MRSSARRCGPRGAHVTIKADAALASQKIERRKRALRGGRPAQSCKAPRGEQVLYELFQFLSKYIKRRAPAAITGGGGKTSLLYGLGAELEKQGRVLLTTTTKIFRPSQEECRDLFIGPARLCGEFLRAMPERAKLAAASGERGGKFIGYAPDELAMLAAHGAADFIIAECDGSRGRSLKFYEEWEPPVPETSAALFAVMGADAFGCEPSEERIFRAAQFCALYGADADAPVTPETVLKYLLCAEGPLKNAPRAAKKILVINKWEILDEARAAEAETLFPALLEKYDAVCAASARMNALYKAKER